MEMLFSIRYASVLGIGLVGLIGGLAYLFVNSASAQNPPLPEPSYELSGQILSRVTPSGTVELCLRTDEGEVLCPENRYLRPETVERDRWLRSSEISWQAPIDVDRIIYSSPELAPPPDDSTCAPDFERMLAATWKVETSRSLGTAFHIGDGRFITAHHVIERRPPFVSLIHGERTIGAAVLGFDAQHDLALLEVETPELLHDVPVMSLRSPTQDDVGQPVYLSISRRRLSLRRRARRSGRQHPTSSACGREQRRTVFSSGESSLLAGGSSFAIHQPGGAVLRSWANNEPGELAGCGIVA